MLSLETENDDDSDSSDEDVSFADMLIRIAKEKEEKEKDSFFSPMAMGAIGTRTSPPMSITTQEMLLHPPRTKGKRQRQLRMQRRTMWLLAGYRLRKDQRWRSKSVWVRPTKGIHPSSIRVACRMGLYFSLSKADLSHSKWVEACLSMP